MIRKYALINKQLTIVAVKPDDESSYQQIIEVMMPLSVYWEVQKLMKDADYLIASREQLLDITEIYKQIFKKLAPYATLETGRTWLYSKSTSQLNEEANKTLF